MRSYGETSGRFTAATAAFLMTVLACRLSCLYAQEAEPSDTAEGCHKLEMPYASLEPDSNFRLQINDAFGVGEYLKFELGYGFIKAGFAEMQVDSLFEHNGRVCYMITTTAQTYKFFDTFYKVRDRGESWVDARGLCSWHFEKHLREGGYKADVSQVFDQFRGLAFEGEDTVMVDRYMQDVLSSLYYVRALDLKVGDTVSIDNYNKKTCYPLDVIVHGREEVKVKAGKFTCLKVEPLLRSAGLFKHEGRLTVFMTDDRLKMPVLMKSKVIVGSITAELMEFRLGELID
jgi:hypothetical protein